MKVEGNRILAKKFVENSNKQLVSRLIAVENEQNIDEPDGRKVRCTYTTPVILEKTLSVDRRKFLLDLTFDDVETDSVIDNIVPATGVKK